MVLPGAIVYDEIEPNDAYIEEEPRTLKDYRKRSFYFLIGSFTSVVLVIVGLAAFVALLFGGCAYVWSPAPQDQRKDQLVEDIVGGTWRYSSSLLEIVLPIFGILFIAFAIHWLKVRDES